MKKDKYKEIEEYMISCMNDSAHDCQHIYRVLFNALDISRDYDVDEEVLIASSLLHDIGREAQFKDPKIDHAVEGSRKAYIYLKSIGWLDHKANHVRECILTHRYRNDNPPDSIEAKILFDADKLDVTGAMGIARTIAYNAIVSMPLYSVNEMGQVLPGDNHEDASFFKEYNYKLKKIYDSFYTEKAKKIAEGRRKASIEFYENIYKEVNATHENGLNILNKVL